MKINRISDSEKYNITSDWLSDFANSIVKEGNYLDRVRERKDFEPKEKFATIEEKMEDIKTRIGFLSSIESISKEASKKTASCECGTCDICSQTKSEKECTCGVCESCKKQDILAFIIKVLNYAKGILSESPTMIPERVISKCRAEIPRFESYEKFMCPEKLTLNISKMVSPKVQSEFEFIPSSEMFDFEEDED